MRSLVPNQEPGCHSTRLTVGSLPASGSAAPLQAHLFRSSPLKDIDAMVRHKAGHRTPNAACGPGLFFCRHSNSKAPPLSSSRSSVALLSTDGGLMRFHQFQSSTPHHHSRGDESDRGGCLCWCTNVSGNGCQASRSLVRFPGCNSSPEASPITSNLSRLCSCPWWQWPFGGRKLVRREFYSGQGAGLLAGYSYSKTSYSKSDIFNCGQRDRRLP